jgi:valyl-tRNA synthetase
MYITGIYIVNSTPPPWELGVQYGDMDKAYEHGKYEQKIYKQWEEIKAFEPKGKKPFCIIMPPPNANDPLHVGHAMFISIEDILTRYHRMIGDDTLWLPGTDHAGIETQFVFEKKLNKEGKSRFSYDRNTLYKMIWDYVQENSQTALSQMKRLGASADWSRTKFTLDPDVVDFVLSTFEKMHKEDLINRGYRMVNYCPKCGTSFSELEVVYKEQNDPLYFIKFGPFTLATVRPETKFGDTAVAVNPKDKRYQEWVDKEVEVDGLLGKFKLKVIADDYVDPEFGTGVVKITPAHDPNDFEVGLRHNLEVKQVIGFDGKLNNLTGPYKGLKVIEARKRVVEDLKAKGLLVKTDEKYIHNISTCYRCGNIIEPLPLPQFFIKVKPLTTAALKALKTGETKIYGAGHDKILKHWLENLKDWNISRQIVWGIRIPVWYKVDGDLTVGFLNKEGKFVSGMIKQLLLTYSFEEIEKGLQTLMAPKDAEYVVSRVKPGDDYLQDTDTFDTWFSSSQWPVVTLKTQNIFENYYPTSVMETGYDILPFWVMRMMMMGIYLTGKSPFKQVYLHGLVRDEKGQKMSKSKGNAINPLSLVEKYGTDALRMALVMSATAGHDSAVGEMKVRGMRNFSNKIWNASRFIIMNRENPKSEIRNPKQDLDYHKHLNKVVEETTKLLDELKIGLAAETVHNEFWHWWCDEILENAKETHFAKASRVVPSSEFLERGTTIFLKLLHPFAPFVTEVCWKELGYEGLLITQEWPKNGVDKR